MTALSTDISNATTQQDKLNLATTAFGTMAEDGSLKFITALTSVGDTYKDVTGAATDFYNQSTTPAQMLEANLRTLHQALVPIGEALMTGLNTVLPPITTAVKFLATIFGAMPDSMKAFVAILAGLIVAMAKIAPIITAISVANTALNISLGPVLLIILAIAAAIAAVIAVVKHWDTISTWLSDTWNTLAEDAQITWDNISTFWSDTWDTIKEKASQTWENISEGAAIFWNNFSTFWANFGLTIYTSTASAWESVKTYLSSTWNNLVTFGAASFLTLRNSVSTTWSNIKSQTSATWDNVKSTISNAMGNAYSTVSSHASSMYSAVSTQFSNIVSSAASAAVGVYNHIYSGFESAWSYISGLPAKAFQWGSDLIDGLSAASKALFTRCTKQPAKSLTLSSSISTFPVRTSDRCEIMRSGCRYDAGIGRRYPTESVSLWQMPCRDLPEQWQLQLQACRSAHKAWQSTQVAYPLRYALHWQRDSTAATLVIRSYRFIWTAVKFIRRLSHKSSE